MKWSAGSAPDGRNCGFRFHVPWLLGERMKDTAAAIGVPVSVLIGQAVQAYVRAWEEQYGEAPARPPRLAPCLPIPERK